jgi:hypothetical protein
LGNEDTGTRAGMTDVSTMTLRELDSIDSIQREQAVRMAFEHTIRNGIVTMGSQSNSLEFSDLSIRHDDM